MVSAGSVQCDGGGHLVGVGARVQVGLMLLQCGAVVMTVLRCGGSFDKT